MLDFVKQKGEYPYEYMNRFKRLFEIRLPDKCEFCSSCRNECVSEKDYSHAVNVWKMFEMEKMGDYHDFYLKTDVLLLADVFEKSIGMCWEYYGLDPCNYFSSPRLS